MRKTVYFLLLIGNIVFLNSCKDKDDDVSTSNVVNYEKLKKVEIYEDNQLFEDWEYVYDANGKMTGWKERGIHSGIITYNGNKILFKPNPSIDPNNRGFMEFEIENGRVKKQFAVEKIINSYDKGNVFFRSLIKNKKTYQNFLKSKKDTTYYDSTNVVYTYNTENYLTKEYTTYLNKNSEIEYAEINHVYENGNKIKTTNKCHYKNPEIHAIDDTTTYVYYNDLLITNNLFLNDFDLTYGADNKNFIKQEITTNIYMKSTMDYTYEFDSKKRLVKANYIQKIKSGNQPEQVSKGYFKYTYTK